MKDERGLYYFPQPGNAKARVYVRRGGDGGVEFRLWQEDHPEVWEKHQWLPTAVLRNAARLYREEKRGPEGSASDPLRLYDESVARALLGEEER